MLFSSTSSPGFAIASVSDAGSSPCGGTGAISAAAGASARSRYFITTTAPIECPTSTGVSPIASTVSSRSSTKSARLAQVSASRP